MVSVLASQVKECYIHKIANCVFCIFRRFLEQNSLKTQMKVGVTIPHHTTLKFFSPLVIFVYFFAQEI